MALLVILIDNVWKDNVARTTCDEVTDNIRTGVACREVKLKCTSSTLVTALVGLIIDGCCQRTVLPREGHLAVRTTLTSDISSPPAPGSISACAITPVVASCEHPCLGSIGCRWILRIATGDQLMS